MQHRRRNRSTVVYSAVRCEFGASPNFYVCPVVASDDEHKQKHGSYYNKPAAPAPPFPHIVIMILPATYCDPASASGPYIHISVDNSFDL